jgi:hypothetical protein
MVAASSDERHHVKAATHGRLISTHGHFVHLRDSFGGANIGFRFRSVPMAISERNYWIAVGVVAAFLGSHLSLACFGLPY